jgi:hypothetical protein
MAMNDNDLMTAVRDRFSPVRMTTPADAIIERGRSLRHRRNRRRLAVGAVAVTLSAGLGASLGIPAVTDGRSSGTAQDTSLTAWVVQKHADGSIGVTIRALRDLPALERKLAADGARVTISYDKLLTLPRLCLAPEFQTVNGMRIFDLGSEVSFRKADPGHNGLYFTLYPARVPRHDVLRITVFRYGDIPSYQVPEADADRTTVTFPGMLGVTAVGAFDVFLTVVWDSRQCVS